MNLDNHWAGLIIAAIAIIGTLILLALIEDAPSQAREQCMDADTRERIRTLTLEGYDEALRNHAAHLFEVWLKDEHDQPRRASVGTQQGISAYVRARALALKWNPPPCT